MKRYLVPLAVFVALAALLAVGLRLDPRKVPSPLVGKPAPAFELPRLDDPQARVAHTELLGRPWVLNVWASWCTPCLAEHPLVTALARDGGVAVVGLNYKDRPEDARRWLARHGDPYTLVLADRDGAVGIDWGVYGVPETFVVDKQGVIRHKHIGPITPAALHGEILPLVRSLGG